MKNQTKVDVLLSEILQVSEQAGRYLAGLKNKVYEIQAIKKDVTRENELELPLINNIAGVLKDGWIIYEQFQIQHYQVRPLIETLERHYLVSMTAESGLRITIQQLNKIQDFLNNK